LRQTVRHITDKMNSSSKEKIIRNKLPRHIAIIMDGNGRWAEKRGNQRIFGHKNAVTAVHETVEAAAELGIEYLTLYAFSTENWRRPRTEIDALMNLLVTTLKSELKNLQENNIRLLSIGNYNSLPRGVQLQLNETIELTSKNTGLCLIIALSYGSRWEITNAVKKLFSDVLSGRMNIDDLQYHDIEKYLDTKGIPDPELLIRTSGEYRLSNFLLCQIAYTELFFTPTLWPDFRKDDLYEAILSFQNRQRRFGKTAEQIDDKMNIN